MEAYSILKSLAYFMTSFSCVVHMMYYVFDMLKVFKFPEQKLAKMFKYYPWKKHLNKIYLYKIVFNLFNVNRFQIVFQYFVTIKEYHIKRLLLSWANRIGFQNQELLNSPCNLVIISDFLVLKFFWVPSILDRFHSQNMHPISSLATLWSLALKIDWALMWTTW